MVSGGFMLKVLLSSSAVILLMGTVFSPLEAGKDAKGLVGEDDNKLIVRSVKEAAEKSDESVAVNDAVVETNPTILNLRRSQENEVIPPVVALLENPSDEIGNMQAPSSQLSIVPPIEEELKENLNQASPLPVIEPENQPEQPRGWGSMFYDYTLGPVVKAGEVVAGYTVTPVAAAAVKVAEATAGGLKAGAEYASAKVKEAQEAAAASAAAARIYNRTLNEGIDFYPQIKGVTQAGVDYMNQPSDFVVSPVAAHFLQGFSQEIMPVIENVMKNAIRLGGPKAGAELAKALGLTQVIGDWGVNAYLNPLKKIGEVSYVMSKINLISHVLKGLDASAFLGSHATKGIILELEESLKKQIARKMRVDPNAGFKDPTRDTDFSKAGFKKAIKQAWKDAPENTKILGFRKVTKFVNRSLEKTLTSMLDDMEQLVGSGLKGTMKIVLFGTENKEKTLVEKVKEQEATSYFGKGVNFLKKYSNPVNIATEFAPAVVKRGAKIVFDEVNTQLGSAAGAAGSAFTEDLVDKFQLSQMKLFAPEQLRLNVSRSIETSEMFNENVKRALTYVDDFIEFDDFLGMALQRAGKKASKKALISLKGPLAAAFQKAGIDRDINELMFKKIQPTKLETGTRKVVGVLAYVVKDTVGVFYNWVMTPELAARAERAAAVEVLDEGDEGIAQEEEARPNMPLALSSSGEFL